LYLLLGAAFLFIAGLMVGISDHNARSISAVVIVFWVAAGVCGAAAPTLPIVRWILARRHDPNAEDVEARKAQGQERAVSKEQYLKMLQEEKEREEAEARADPSLRRKEWWERKEWWDR
jgi:hypothetical protein